MNDAQKQIQASAIKGLEGRLGADTRPNFCLNFARKVAEDFLGLPSGGFYRLIGGADANPAAREAEAQIRRSHPDWLVSTAQVGDLVWWKDSRPQWGHVGVVIEFLGQLCVAQNTTRATGVIRQYVGALRIIPLMAMPQPSSITRFPELHGAVKPQAPIPAPVTPPLKEIPVRLFDPSSNEQIGTGTLIGDKVYVKGEL